MRRFNNFTGSLYLNNSGSRWVSWTKGERDKITLQTKSGKSITRTPIYFYMFGNWAGAIISYKGKKIRVLMDTILED
jgi:hypothetical protein